MKKILLIGKPDDELKALGERLSRSFGVCFGSCVPFALFSGIEMYKPDMLVISLSGIKEAQSDLCAKLKESFPDIPALTFGKADEPDLPGGGVYENIAFSGDFAALCSELCGKVCERLGCKDEPERRTVMVIDDDAAMLRFTKSILEEDFNVMLSPSGTKAMSLLEKKRPDIIFLDYEMPVVNGEQTLGMIRGREETKDIPVVFLTGTKSPEMLEKTHSLPCSGVIFKPMERESLIQTLHQCMKSLYN